MIKSPEKMQAVAEYFMEHGANKMSACALHVGADRATIYRWLHDSRELQDDCIVRFASETMYFHQACEMAQRLYFEKIKWDDPDAAAGAALGMVRRGPSTTPPAPVAAPVSEPLTAAPADAPAVVEIEAAPIVSEPRETPASEPTPRADPLADKPGDSPGILEMKRMARDLIEHGPAHPVPTLPVAADSLVPARPHPLTFDSRENMPDRIGAGKPPPGGVSRQTGKAT